MANILTTVFEEIFGQVEERLRQYAPVFAIRGTIAQNGLNGGKTYQFANDPDDVARPSQTNSDVAFNDIDAGETVLDVGENQFEYSFRLDRRDSNKLQRAPQFIAGKAMDAIKQLTRQFDGQFFGEVFDEANTTFDESDLSGGTGSITLTASNAIQIISQALAKLDNAAGPRGGDTALVVSPTQLAFLKQANVANGFREADNLLTEDNNNELGVFIGARVFKSQFLTHTAVLTYADGTNFVAATKLVLNGDDLIAVASPTVAGDFDIGADADASATNLVALINDPANAAASSDYVALGTFNSLAVANFNGVSATLDAANDEITLVSKRGSFGTTSSTLTGAVATGFGNGALTNQTVHNYVGIIGNGGPELAIAEGGIINETRDEPKQPTQNFMSFADFGTATPFFAKDRILDLQIFA